MYRIKGTAEVKGKVRLTKMTGKFLAGLNKEQIKMAALCDREG